MRVLVVGMGFIGSNAARRFVDENISVVALDPMPRMMDYVEEVVDKIKIVKQSVSDLQALGKIVEEEKPDVILHTALSPLASSFLDTFQVNIAGTVNVLEVARKRSLRVVYLSSGAVYGQLKNNGPISEEEPFGPTFPPRVFDGPWAPFYGTSKRICEQLMALHRFAHGMESCALRLGLVYGRGDRYMNSSVPFLLRKAISGQSLILPYGGDTYCPLVHVFDVVEAIFKACTVDRLESLSYNVAYNRGYWMKEIGEAVERAVPGSSIKFGPGTWPSHGVPIPRGSALSFPTNRPLDISRAQKELGYMPIYDLDKGINEAAEWIRRNWSTCSPEAVPFPA